MSNQVNAPKWPNNISGLRGTDLRMLVFPSRKEYDKGMHLFYTDEEVMGVPFVMSPKVGKGFAALVLPAAAIFLLRAKGLKFRVVEPIAEADLTPKQRKELKRKKIYLIHIGTGMDPQGVYVEKFTAAGTAFHRKLEKMSRHAR